MLEVYREAGVDPSNVSYVELHSHGMVEGDLQEINSVAEVFCSNQRSTPLLVGSTTSNMGHSEAAGGLVALVKILIAMHDYAIPANLHFSQRKSDIPGFSDDRLKVYTRISFLLEILLQGIVI